MLISVSDSGLTNDLLFCSCGAPKARTSKTCNTCFLKKRWGDFHARKKKNPFVCLCACGCGLPVKHKRNRFNSKKCSWMFKRLHKEKKRDKLCLCGCKRVVDNNLKNYATRECSIKSKNKSQRFVQYRDSEGFLNDIDKATIIGDAIRGNQYAIKALRDLRFTKIVKNGVTLVL